MALMVPGNLELYTDKRTVHRKCDNTIFLLFVLLLSVFKIIVGNHVSDTRIFHNTRFSIVTLNNNM